MAFEYHNPHVNAIDATLPNGRTIRIKKGEYVPTPEQEEEGIEERSLRDFVGPSFLAPTPPKKRRELLEAAKLPVPADLEERTRPRPPAQPAGARAAAGGPGPAAPNATPGVTPPAKKIETVPPSSKVPSTQQLPKEDETFQVLQRAADKASSSFKGERSEQA